jgi:hypothetical protein
VTGNMMEEVGLQWPVTQWRRLACSDR